jgi:hypothetical protein
VSGTLTVHRMTIDGHPYGCPSCGCWRFTLDPAGPLDRFPALGNCLEQAHHWDDPLITNAVLADIHAARTGRRKAGDEDTFRVKADGAVLEGVLAPEWTPDDLRQVGKVLWRRVLKPAVRGRKRRVRQVVVGGPAAAVKRAAGRAAGKAVGAVTAPALRADWELAAGGWDEEPATPCGACGGEKGFAIDSRLHDDWVRCSVCHGTGQT